MVVRQPLELVAWLRNWTCTSPLKVVVSLVRWCDPSRYHPRSDGIRRVPAFELRKAGFVTRDARQVERKKAVCVKHVVVRSSPNVNWLLLGRKQFSKKPASAGFFMAKI